MAVNPDFRDLFVALNDARAKYLLVGGYAVAFHGQPRFTKDLDVWIEASVENASRVFAALSTFGAPLENLTPTDLTQLIQNKRASGRPQDLLDLKALT